MKHDEPKWYWISNHVQMAIPDQHALMVMRDMLIQTLKIRMFLMATVFDGGKEIRIPLDFGQTNDLQ